MGVNSEENRVRHVLAVTMGHAIREGAHKIRFVARPDNSYKRLLVSVLFADDQDNWQEQMKLPDYVRESLFEELRRFSQATELHNFELEMLYFGIKVQWHLTFDFAPDEAGNQSALIALEPPSSGDREILD